ncbi:YqiA/YcfP family alpha/beta fold hydrolase [Myroides marinus]|nr:YqiA/YcfP family alpha/beta fold hydrolase [Myroides marinus]
MMKDLFLLYIHGYGSNRESRKFFNLKESLPDFPAAVFEWDEHTDFELLLKTAIEQTNEIEQIVLVGDSTGANIAYQIRETRKSLGLSTILVLTSPLLDYDKRLNTELQFAENLQNSLMKINKVEDALVILAKEDEAIDFSQFDVKQDAPNSTVIYVEDNHRLEGFMNYVGYIIGYIVNKSVRPQ